MKNYKCKYGLFHDKPCLDGEPSSNNGWIYSAYAKKLGFLLDMPQLNYVADKCIVINEQQNNSFVSLIRLPNKHEPPMSRDEIIGMASLGFIKANHLMKANWYFRGTEPQAYLYQQIIALYKIKDEHRNYVWQNKIIDAYPIVFKLFWHDRFYVKKMSGEAATLFEFLMFYLYMIAILLQGSAGEKNLLWLQLSDLNSFFRKFINVKANLQEYFGKEHLFSHANLRTLEYFRFPKV